MAIWTRTGGGPKAGPGAGRCWSPTAWGCWRFSGICGVQALGSVDVSAGPARSPPTPRFYLGLRQQPRRDPLGFDRVRSCSSPGSPWGPAPVRGRTRGRGLLAAAGLTTLLLADDLLLLARPGVPLRVARSLEHQTLVIYGVIGISCLLVAFRLIRESPDRILFVSVVVLLRGRRWPSTSSTRPRRRSPARARVGGRRRVPRRSSGWLAFWSRAPATASSRRRTSGPTHRPLVTDIAR